MLVTGSPTFGSLIECSILIVEVGDRITHIGSLVECSHLIVEVGDKVPNVGSIVEFSF